MRWAEVLDVARELADPAGGDLVREPVTEAQALELAQLAQSVDADDPRFGDGVQLRPVGPQALDRLRAVADIAAPLQVQRGERAHQLGLQGGTELATLAADDVGDREGIAGVGLARALAAAFAVRPPRRHVHDFEPRRRERADERAAIAAGAFDADHRRAGVVFGQPVKQAAIPVGAVGEHQDAEFGASVIQQRGGVSAFVDVDADEHQDLRTRE